MRAWRDGKLGARSAGERQVRRLLAAAALGLVFAACQAGATVREGIDMPDRVDDLGRSLVLNGVAVRTISVLGIRVYVAALYLAEPNHDAQAVLDDPSPKRIDLVFLRSVDRSDAVRAWRRAFELNCPAPCRAPAGVEPFLAAQPDIEEGDHQIMRFDRGAVSFVVNDRELLRQEEPDFARLVLETFIGRVPPSSGFRASLLGLTD